jgi:GNAT superfamily N-acetyltransferase
MVKVISAKVIHRKDALKLFRALDRLAPIWLEYTDLETVDEAIENHQVKVAVEDDKIVGVIALVPRKNHLSIGALFVDSKRRKQGVGSKLIKAAIKAAKKLGKPRITVATAFEYNAKGFYEKCGFYRTRTYHDCWALSYKI